jgi:hypothetical protein
VNWIESVPMGTGSPSLYVPVRTPDKVMQADGTPAVSRARDDELDPCVFKDQWKEGYSLPVAGKVKLTLVPGAANWSTHSCHASWFWIPG